MKRLRIVAPLCVMVSPLVAAAATFDRFCDTLAAEWMRADPQAATALQYFSGTEQDALNRQLTPITKGLRKNNLYKLILSQMTESAMTLACRTPKSLPGFGESFER